MPDFLTSRGLALIERQLAHWDLKYGNSKVSQWLFDIAFFRLYKAYGYKYANDLLTETRKALRRSEGNRKLMRYWRGDKYAAIAELKRVGIMAGVEERAQGGTKSWAKGMKSV